MGCGAEIMDQSWQRGQHHDFRGDGTSQEQTGRKEGEIKQGEIEEAAFEFKEQDSNAEIFIR